jgi:serine protease Do
VQKSRYEPPAKPLRTPEDIPTMDALMAPRTENKCIHCHDVKVAELRHLQAQNRFKRDMVFTYPTPAAVGIRLEPSDQNQVNGVAPGSPAEQAGIRPGDVVQAADSQRILTFADFSRVLELTPVQGKLPLEIRRGAETIRAELQLSGDWRRSGDPSWRESLHVAGPSAGFWGMKLTAEERQKLDIPVEAMAVKVTFIWGDYTRKAGVKVGDLVVELDGIRRDMTINQVHAHLMLNRNYGDTVRLIVRRDGKDHECTLELPPQPPAGE